MKRSVALVALLVLLLPGAAWSQGLPTATPEEVGLSSQKLRRVSEVVKGESRAQPGPRRGEDGDLFRQLVQAAIVD